MSTLYLVATPIGNLGDMSARAIDILKSVSLVAAEDTRHSAKLLNHFEITTPTTSYFDHNKRQKQGRILSELERGDVALISDAGTPSINDPGYELVKAAIADGREIIAIPGANAPLSALIVSGLATDRFLYLGYLPRKQQERIASYQEIIEMPYTLIFFESPKRLVKSLIDMKQVFGNRKISVAAELTKKFERVFRGTIDEAINHIKEVPPRGEYTLVVEGKHDGEGMWTIEDIKEAIDKQISIGNSPSEIAKFLVVVSGWRRRDIYQLITKYSEEKE
jgi:16S rRNA (cytidine1402-2'-O)-methyltransferase